MPFMSRRLTCRLLPVSLKKILKFLRRETWFRTPREERRLRVIENKLLKIMQTLDVQLRYVQRILRDKEIPNSWYALDIAIGSSCQKSRNGNMYISRPTRCTSSCNVSLLIIKCSTCFGLFSPSSGATFWSCISQWYKPVRLAVACNSQ